MTLSTALNVLWALLGTAVLLANLRAERGRTVSRGLLRRWSAVLLVVLALFPVISVSDDELGFSSLRTSTQSSGVADPATQQLIRALQALENLQVSTLFAFALTLFCFGFVLPLLYRGRVVQARVRAVRGPPVDA